MDGRSAFVIFRSMQKKRNSNTGIRSPDETPGFSWDGMAFERLLQWNEMLVRSPHHFYSKAGSAKANCVDWALLNVVPGPHLTVPAALRRDQRVPLWVSGEHYCYHFCGDGVQILCLTCAKQALYHWAVTPALSIRSRSSVFRNRGAR